MYPCCSTEDVPAPAMAIPDHPSDVRDGMVQHKGQDNIPPRNTVPFAQPSFPARCDGDDLPACAIGNDFREANTRRWKLRSSRAQPLSSNPMMGWTRRDGHPVPIELDFPSAEAAVAYAKRQGLNSIVQGSAEATLDAA